MGEGISLSFFLAVGWALPTEQPYAREKWWGEPTLQNPDTAHASPYCQATLQRLFNTPLLVRLGPEFQFQPAALHQVLVVDPALVQGLAV